MLPRSVLTYISARGKGALSASVVLYVRCTALVHFAPQLHQVKAQLLTVQSEMQCPPGLEGSQMGVAEVASGPGRTAMATGLVQSCKVHPTPLAAFMAIILRPVVLDPSHIRY